MEVTEQADVDAVIAGLERLDLLVNCAGVLQRDGREFTIEGFAATLAVNLTGTMRLCLACKAMLTQSGGSIINTASMMSYFGAPHAPAYAASKGGVAQLTKSLAAAWAEDGVRVNAIAPGWIRTDLTQRISEDAARSAVILGRTPMLRWGEAEEVADVAVFLASDRARFMTGANVNVDGGYASA